MEQYNYTNRIKATNSLILAIFSALVMALRGRNKANKSLELSFLASTVSGRTIILPLQIDWHKKMNFTHRLHQIYQEVQ